MKQFYSIFLVFFFCSKIGYGQELVMDWQRCYGGTDRDRASTIELAKDGGYAILGSTISQDGDVKGNKGDYDIWLVKTNASGIVQWQNPYGGTQDAHTDDKKRTNDGGYIIVGTTKSDDGEVSGNKGDADIWVVKVDSAGGFQWQSCLGGTGKDEAASILPTKDGGYIVLGSVVSNDMNVSGNHGNGDIWVVKLNASGSMQWQKCLGGSAAEKAADVVMSNDGNYIITGSTFSSDGDVSGNTGDFDIWVVAIDVNGNILWNKSYGGTRLDEGKAIYATNDGGSIVAGYTNSNDGMMQGNHGIIDYCLLKLDKDGNLEWKKILGGYETDLANDVIQTTNGDYMVCGTTYSNNGDVNNNRGAYDYWVVRLDNTGAVEWEKCLGGSFVESATSIKETMDGCIILGETYSVDGDVTNMRGGSDNWVVKMKYRSLTTTELTNDKLIVYPNPAQNVLHFSQRHEYAIIYSVDGRKMITTANSDRVDVTKLPRGVYYLKAFNGNEQILSQSFLKE